MSHITNGQCLSERWTWVEGELSTGDQFVVNLLVVALVVATWPELWSWSSLVHLAKIPDQVTDDHHDHRAHSLAPVVSLSRLVPHEVRRLVIGGWWAPSRFQMSAISASRRTVASP